MSQSQQPVGSEPSPLCLRNVVGETEWFSGCVVFLFPSPPGGLVFRMVFFLCAVCAFCCMQYMPFCDLSPLHTPLPFQWRSDCVCHPADLRESVKGWPSQASAWPRSCWEQSHQRAKGACICLPDYFFLLLYSICFSKCATFSKAISPGCLSSEMLILLSLYIFARH